MRKSKRGAKRTGRSVVYRESLLALDSQQRNLNFCVHSAPPKSKRGAKRTGRSVAYGRIVVSSGFSAEGIIISAYTVPPSPHSPSVRTSCFSSCAIRALAFVAGKLLRF